jgi:hypothetical protein
VLEVTATIAELEKKATQVKPKGLSVKSRAEEASASADTLEPESFLRGGQRKTKREAVSEEVDADSANVSLTTSPKSSDFDWTALVEQTRQKYVAVYSVLSKCHHQLDGDTLTLYTGNKFYKKKLDDQKYNSLLYKALEEVGIYGLTIHTIPTAPPPRDSQAASIAAIMGGGEEVTI